MTYVTYNWLPLWPLPCNTFGLAPGASDSTLFTQNSWGEPLEFFKHHLHKRKIPEIIPHISFECTALYSITVSV